MGDLNSNSIIITYNKAKGVTKYAQFKSRNSKPIIDEIVKVLAKHYGFTEEVLDYIINYAAQKGITIMPCFFNFGDFRYEGTDKGPSKWINNPYHTLLKLNQPHEFFTNAEARRITRNLIRYIVSRWGYATNIVAWELWNEVSNMDFDDQAPDTYCRNIVNWDKEMADVVRTNHPFNHLISTSMGGADPDGCLY